jgi:hypothetical protein
MIDHINWRRIADAIDFYQSLGFDYVEVPWKVSVDSAKVTCPPDGILEMSGDLVLAASAEQGFIDLKRDGLLPKWGLGGVNYVACTPCFRVHDAGRSPIHHPYFMKVELFCVCESDIEAAQAAHELINRAYRFMDCKLDKVETDKGWDLEVAGIEVGSYGWHHHPEVGYWAYGTGLAEPRFSQALEKLNKDD